MIKTLAEFKETFSRRGNSVLDLAYHAQEIVDDPEFVALAKAAVEAEDSFLKALNERDIELG